jgi:hypothetical protein
MPRPYAGVDREIVTVAGSDGAVSFDPETRVTVGGLPASGVRGAFGTAHMGMTEAEYGFQTFGNGVRTENGAFAGTTPGTFELGITQSFPGTGNLTDGGQIPDLTNPLFGDFYLIDNAPGSRVAVHRAPDFGTTAADQLPSTGLGDSAPAAAAVIPEGAGTSRFVVTTENGNLCVAPHSPSGFGTADCEPTSTGPSRVAASASGYVGVSDLSGNQVKILDARSAVAAPTEVDTVSVMAPLGIAVYEGAGTTMFCVASTTTSTIVCFIVEPGGVRVETLDVSSDCAGPSFVHLSRDGDRLVATCNDATDATDAVIVMLGLSRLF